MACLAGKNGKLIPRWFWTVFVCLPLGLMAYWFLRWFFLPSYQRTSSVEIETPRKKVVRTPVRKDDFRVLKGIGPKTAGAIYRAGIFSYKQLALVEPEKLAGILKKQSLPTGSIDFWQQQAALAAAGDWEGLERLQG